MSVPYGPRIGTRSSRLLPATALAASPLVGCESDDDNGRPVERARPCDLFLPDQGVSVRTASEGAERTCTSWLASRAEGRGTWSGAAGADADSGLERVCVVFRGHTAAGVYRCLTEPEPGSPVTCDSYNERCTQAGHAVRTPDVGAGCCSGDRRWQEVTGDDASRVYRRERA
jgi:hypothetical protein